MLLVEKSCDPVDDFIIDEKFSSYLDFVKYLLCPRCYYKTGLVWHHFGSFNNFLESGNKINTEQFANWKNDLDHGFFHGLMTGFWIYCQYSNNQKDVMDGNMNCTEHKNNEILSRNLYSALFHDFLKCSGIKDGHDSQLSFFFPDCDPETYCHSNPDDNHSNSKLVVSDRIELHRFSDCDDWIDTSKIGSFFRKKKSFVKQFYLRYRDGLKQIYRDRESIWFSHLSEEWFQPEEIKQYYSDFFHHQYYPEFHWVFPICQENRKQYYSVYGDYMPLEKCNKHVVEILDYNISCTLGIIQKRKILDYENKICLGFNRDHPLIFKKKPIPQSEWIFIYRNKSSDLKTIDPYKNTIISFKTLDNFFDVVRLLFAKIDVIKIV